MPKDKQDPSPPPYDQAIANQAAAVDQCLKLGGVILTPSKPQTGFGGNQARRDPLKPTS